MCRILIIVILGWSVAAQERTPRFEVTEDFLRSRGRDPVQSLDVKLDCAGPAHSPATDCEIHVGAELVDPSISDGITSGRRRPSQPTTAGV